MLEIIGLSHRYQKKQVLRNLTFRLEAGKMYAVVGKSGSGKTTLLSLLAGIDKVQKGAIVYKGTSLEEQDLTEYRRKIGIIFQSYNLINYMSAIQNVVVALDIVGRSGDREKIAKDYLKKVGITEEDFHRDCTKLSGGQQQRVAIARALACNSEIIFADEPTGNLDGATGLSIIKTLQRLALDEGKCVFCVTHDNKLANEADVIMHLSSGVLKERKN